MASELHDDPDAKDKDKVEELPEPTDEEVERLASKFGWRPGDVTVTPPPEPEEDPERTRSCPAYPSSSSTTT